jgi:transposase
MGQNISAQEIGGEIMSYKPLTDQQWEEIAWMLPVGNRLGRKRIPDREIVEAILFVLSTGSTWWDLPSYFPPRATVHRRFKELEKAHFFEKAFAYLRRKIPDTDIYYIDGTLKPAKKGEACFKNQKVS